MPRVIIFQKKYQKESPKEDSTSKEESLQSDEQVTSDTSIEDFPSTFKERKFEQNCNRLKNIIESIKNCEKNSNMIGVFGIYSDKVVKEALKNISDVVFYNKIDYDGTIDLYDCILSQLLVFVNNKEISGDWSYAFARKLFWLNDKLNPTNNIERLDFIFKKFRKYIYIKKISEEVFFREQLIIYIEAKNIDYEILNKLDNLNSKYLIIILSCALETSIIRKLIEEKDLLSGVDCLEKYFSDDNLILAD